MIIGVQATQRNRTRRGAVVRLGIGCGGNQTETFSRLFHSGRLCGPDHGGVGESRRRGITGTRSGLTLDANGGTRVQSVGNGLSVAKTNATAIITITRQQYRRRRRHKEL